MKIKINAQENDKIYNSPTFSHILFSLTVYVLLFIYKPSR